jgi:two-component system phosphate regulon sensor histidine kinase PhoR
VDAARALGEISDGVLLVDTTNVIRYLNPAAARLLDLDGSSIGANVGALVPRWDQFELAVQGERGAPVVVPLSRRGAELWLACSVVRFDEGAVYTLRDITEERLLERTRNEFVATASHELRTPVTAVFGAARTLRRRDIELTPEQRERFLQIIDEEAERLIRIVDQMLAASRLETGEMKLEPAPCAVAPVLESLAESVFGEHFVLFAPANLVAVCDRDRLRQVLLNLLDNAVKYSPDGGEIVVAADGDETWIRIVVRDRGIGLPSGSEERVFEKFFRLDPEQTGGVGGTGLGLYISRELVIRMGGRIHARANRDGGSTFTVELPRAG